MILKCNESGSSGNGYVLQSNDEILLIEAGTPAKKMLKSIDYQSLNVVGCLVSHAHTDHAKYIKDYAMYGIKMYASDEVAEDIETIYGEKVTNLKRTREENIGKFSVVPFSVPHNDTPCDGFLIRHKDLGSLLFITDAEYCPYDFSKFQINHIMVECNYSKDYINHEEVGNYEHVLRGHMELETCKRLIEANKSGSLRSIGLMHLSDSNGHISRFWKEISRLVDCDVDVYITEAGLTAELNIEPF